MSNKNYGTLDEEAHNNNNNNLNPLNNTSYTVKDIRIGFIKKVYSIIFVQLLLTTTIVFACMSITGLKRFQLENPAVKWICFGILVVILIMLACFTETFKKVPLNYILLLIFTLCESYLTALLCNTTEPRLVLMAACLTTGIVLALTLYACVTDTDYTRLGAILFCAGMILLVGSILLIFVYNKVLHLVLTCLGVLLFSIYLIYDTQLILGRGKYKLTEDDYIIGALIVYADIIALFSELLTLLRLT